MGKVVQVGARTLAYKLLKDVSAQDVVEFRNSKMIPNYEYTLGRDWDKGNLVQANYLKGSRIAVGDEVYRTKNAPLLASIREKYIEKEKKIEVKARFIARKGMPVRLQIGDDRAMIEVQGDICQSASNQPTTQEAVSKKLLQTGESLFKIVKLEFEIEEALFLPVSTLKKLRREALEEFETAIIEKFRREMPYTGNEEWQIDGVQMEDHIESHQKVVAVSIHNREQLEPVLSIQEVAEVYLKMESLPESELLGLSEQIVAAGKLCYLVLPHILRQSSYQHLREEWGKEASAWESVGLAGYLVRNMESFVFLREELGVSPDRIILDSSVYSFNQQAISYWKEQGVTRMTLPLELTEKEIHELGDNHAMQFIAYAHPPLMISAQCVRYNTKGCMGTANSVGTVSKEQIGHMHFLDEKQRKYHVVNYCSYCYNAIYGEEPLHLIEEAKALAHIGSIRYDFLDETAEQVKDILENHIEAKGSKGHYYKGVE